MTKKRQDRSVKLAAALQCYFALAWIGCGTAGGAEESGNRSAARAVLAYAVGGDTLRVRLSSGHLAYVRLVGMLSRLLAVISSAQARSVISV